MSANEPGLGGAKDGAIDQLVPKAIPQRPYHVRAPLRRRCRDFIGGRLDRVGIVRVAPLRRAERMDVPDAPAIANPEGSSEAEPPGLVPTGDRGRPVGEEDVDSDELPAIGKGLLVGTCTLALPLLTPEAWDDECVDGS